MKKLHGVLLATVLLLSALGKPALAANTADSGTQYCRSATQADGSVKCSIADQGVCPDGWNMSPKACTCKELNPKGGYNETDECVQIDNPIASGATDINGLIGIVIKAGLGIVGAITLWVFFSGARQWIMAAGNSEKIQSGASAMLWAALGLLMIFSSYVLLNLTIPFITGVGIGAPPK